MDVYGLTGGIGSGKTTVAELLEDYGVPVVSADELSRIVVSRGSDGLADVVSSFGREVLDDQGELDRRKMAAIVFQDPAKRRQLEAILHPRIRERFEQVLDALEKAGHEVAVYEVPLLFEKNLQGEMQAVILVTADAAVRTRRVRARDDITETEIRARMAAQMDETLKRKRADYIIENNGTMDDLRREVEFLLDRFLRVGSRHAAAEAASSRMSMFDDDEHSNPSRVPTEIPSAAGLPVDGHVPAFASSQVATRGKTLPPLSDDDTIGGTPASPSATPTTPAPGPPQGLDSSGAPPSYPSSAPTLPGGDAPPTIPSAASISRASSKTVPAPTGSSPAPPTGSTTTPVPPPAAPPGPSSRAKTAPAPAPPPELLPTLPGGRGPKATQPMTPITQRRTEGVETVPPSERKTVGLSTDPPPQAQPQPRPAVPTPIREETTPPRGGPTDTAPPRQGNPDAPLPASRSRRRKTMPASHFERLRPPLPGTNRPAPPGPTAPTTPNVPPAPTPVETSTDHRVEPPPPPKPDVVPPPPPPKADPTD